MTATMTEKTKAPFNRYLPLAAIAMGAAAGYYFLGDHLTFDALRDNRETLIGFRDANYLLTVLIFMAVYVVITAFSLPGAALATLTGGFLFATFPGALFNVLSATLGAIAIFQAARWGFGDRLSAKLDASDGAVKKIKDGPRTINGRCCSSSALCLPCRFSSPIWCPPS